MHWVHGGGRGRTHTGAHMQQPGDSIYANPGVSDTDALKNAALQVKEVRLAQAKAKAGDYDIYATRFVGEGGRVLLSCILHGAPAGQYDPAALEAWAGLHAKWGDVVPLE